MYKNKTILLTNRIEIIHIARTNHTAVSPEGDSMRVVMLVGVLLVNVIVGLYGNGSSLNVSPDAGLSDAPEVRACDFPVPPSWP
jgi:hypothetical protein